MFCSLGWSPWWLGFPTVPFTLLWVLGSLIQSPTKQRVPSLNKHANWATSTKVVVQVLNCLEVFPPYSTIRMKFQGFEAECPFNGLGLWVAVPLSVLAFFLAPRMPSSTLIPFLVGLGSLINPFKQKMAPFFILGYWAT